MRLPPPPERLLSRREAVASLAGLGSALLLRTSPARGAPDLRSVPLSFAVALDGEGPVRDGAWLDAQIGAMEALYLPFGLRPVKVLVRSLSASLLHMESRADRDALANELRPGVANVFVVGTLRDVDEPDRMRKGVHWRNRANPARRYVILSSEAPETVLAHEMGHYFGLGHSAVKDNVMSYDRTGGPVFFDAAQEKVIRAAAAAAFRSRELVSPPDP